MGERNGIEQQQFLCACVGCPEQTAHLSSAEVTLPTPALMTEAGAGSDRGKQWGVWVVSWNRMSYLGLGKLEEEKKYLEQLL